MNLRVRIRFANGNLLELNEALQVQSQVLVWVDYRYHYQNTKNQLIFRYDNTPHFPDLASFPHHKHLPDQVIACARPELVRDLRENKVPGEPPPSPQFWGDMNFPKPPELGVGGGSPEPRKWDVI